MKEKNSSILTKALNEADTIRAGALKNAQDILFQAFQPHFKQMFNNVVNEQVGIVDQDPMDGPEAGKYDQDKSEADLVNPDNAMHKEGEGPELLEQEETDLDLEEQDEMGDEDFLEQLESDIEIEEQEDEDEIQVEQEDLEDLGDVDEQDDFELDLEEQEEVEEPVEEQAEVEDEPVDEQDDFDLDLEEQAEVEDEPVEEQDEFELDLDEQEDIEIIDDETMDEQDNPDVNPSKDVEYKTAANEVKKLKDANKKLQLENKKLSEGVKKLANKISEVNLFNAKVACANRVLSIKGLNESTKVTVLNTLDKCKNIREVKVAYTSFKNFVKTNNIKKQNTIKESKNLAALKTKTIGYKKQNTLNESDSKMLRLAGLRD